MAIFLLIIGLVLFVGLVVIHEFGHFIMARRNGVQVEEFGIGFPPAFWRKRIKSSRGDYDFTLNVLPLGGFVRLKGEHDSDTAPGTFGAAPLGVKVKIMVAGVVMNLLAAYVLLLIISLVGMPQLVSQQFTVEGDAHVMQQASTKVLLDSVVPNSPAAQAGLQKGDQIVTVGLANIPQTIIDASSLQRVTAFFAGREVVVQYNRAGQAKQTTVQLNSKQTVMASQKTKQPVGYLGVSLNETTSGVTLIRSTWSAPIVAAGVIGQFTALTFQGLGHAVAGLGSIIAGLVTDNNAARSAGQTSASAQVSGPIGIFVLLKDGSALGVQFVLFVVAIISLSLALMNILPIPALDGGRLWFSLIARAFGRPLSEKAEELINGVGFVVLIGLIILISVVDVKRFF